MLYNSNFRYIHGVIYCVWVFICSSFQGTEKFIIAFIIAFIMDLYAGLRSSNYKITTLSFWIQFKKIIFNGFLILSIILLLHQIYVLMIDSKPALIITRISMGGSIFLYIVNTMRNLIKSYPNVIHLKFLGILVEQTFKKIAPKQMTDAIEKAEKQHKQQTKNNSKTNKSSEDE